MWINKPLPLPGKTKLKNIIKVLPGPKLDGREGKTEFERFLNFFFMLR